MKKTITLFLLTITYLIGYSQPAISPAEREGTDFYKQGKSAEAIASFKKALVERPTSLYSINALANLYLMDKKYQDAYLIADKGISLSNGAPTFIVVKAKAAIRINKEQEALNIIDKYLATHQPDFMMLFVKGGAFNVLGDRQQALALFSQSIATNADFPDAYLARGEDFEGIG
ncbi:MAG: tetratricopeptide repeat protein, partial [Mucilaginibacter sp.]